MSQESVQKVIPFKESDLEANRRFEVTKAQLNHLRSVIDYFFRRAVLGLIISLTGLFLLAASEYKNYDLVFASEIGTPLQRKNLTDRHFKPLLEKAELPNIRLYDLRHTTETLLLSAGENPKVVSERLGHASIVLTLDTYRHVLPIMQQSATDKLEKMMFGI